MRVDLPSGNYVVLRDKLMASDRFAVQDAIVLTISGPGSQKVGAGIQNQMRNALLGQIITEWSFDGVPVPSQNDAGTEIIGSTLDIDDYNHLADQVEEMLQKVSFSPNPPASRS